MTLDQVPAGAQVFVDANILVYHFQPHPAGGRIEYRGCVVPVRLPRGGDDAPAVLQGSRFGRAAQ